VDRQVAFVDWLATGRLTPAQVRAALDLQSDAIARSPATRTLSAIEIGRLEEDIGAWLEAHDVTNQWDLAPTFVAVGLDVAWLERAAQALGSTGLSGALNWIGDALLATAILDQIDDATARISQLVSVVRDYSYVDRSVDQEIDIHEGIEKTLVILKHKLRTGIDVVREYDSALPRIRGDGSELNQVWTNLIDNAIDAMDGHGQLRIRTSHDMRAVLVEITDQGRGIPSELASRIFDPFFTTKEVGKGSGLGLDIVRRIVTDRYGGEVSFESVPGETLFLVRLPLAPS
jgi:signal transduction histidine kinase